MLRIRTKSISVKFILILTVTVAIVLSAASIAAYQLRTILLRNTSQAIAEQVIAFRGWIASSGVVWVNNLQPNFPDFLGQKICADSTFYSKNPALATRELSSLVSHSAIGATFRVTSDNFRNLYNKPDIYEANAITTFKLDLSSAPGDKKTYVEAYEGDTYRYSIPITVARACLKCHGSPKDAPKEVIEKYGAQRGFGYQAGDIRGIITVSLPTISLLSTSPVTNVYSLILILAAFFLNFVLFKRVIINRIKKMTAATEKMTHGELDLDISEDFKKGTRDEIDKLYNALDLMRRSVKIMIDKVRKH